jgi:hypothetical protein
MNGKVVVVNRSAPFVIEVERPGSAGAKRSPVLIPIRGPAPKFGAPPTAPQIAGFILTPGIPADVWNAWCERERVNGYGSALESGLVFACETVDEAMSKARAHAARGKGK